MNRRLADRRRRCGRDHRAGQRRGEHPDAAVRALHDHGLVTGMSQCPAYTHRHPKTYLALHTRSRLIGTLNLAIALRGKSCGWGSCDKPRRTFVGFHRRLGAPSRPPFDRAIELVLCGDGLDQRTLFRIPLGSGVTTWRFSR